MLKLKKIAVTGGLASGKTAVCQICAKLGAYTVSADDIVHKLLSSNNKVTSSIVELLGSDIIEETGLNRKKIAEKVFSNPEKLHSLEKIIHPLVIEEIETQYNQVKTNTNYSFFIAEIPLVYEANAAHLFDYILCVDTHPELAQERFIKKTGHSKTEYENRMKFQLPLQEKIKKSDFVIVNNGDYTALKTQVYLLIKELQSK